MDKAFRRVFFSFLSFFYYLLFCLVALHLILFCRNVTAIVPHQFVNVFRKSAQNSKVENNIEHWIITLTTGKRGVPIQSQFTETTKRRAYQWGGSIPRWDTLTGFIQDKIVLINLSRQDQSVFRTGQSICIYIYKIYIC